MLSQEATSTPTKYDITTTKKTKTDYGILFLAASFLYHTNGSNVYQFGNFLREFNDAAPLGNLKDSLKVITAIVQHPTKRVLEISKITCLPLEKIRTIQKWMQGSNMVKGVMHSHYYPGYLLIQYANTMLKGIDRGGLNYDDINSNAAPNKIEIHVTDANCNYRCVMCLWHVKGLAKYNHKHKELLGTDDWKKILSQAKDIGTETVIFSGGGEPLLRKDTGEIIVFAKSIGLKTMVYTNGSQLLELRENNNQYYQQILKADWIRISMHATTKNRYSKIVGVSNNINLIERVIGGIKKLKEDRDRLGLTYELGIGFVIQAMNWDQVEDIVNIAQHTGVDFINLRVDCIDVTEKLTCFEENQLTESLRKIRDNYETGCYGNLSMDFDDRLIAQINEWGLPEVEQPEICRVHRYRPAINPFGEVGVCDITAEPFFQRDELLLGRVTKEDSLVKILEKVKYKNFKTSLCEKCMPGQKAINALWYKVLEDYKLNFKPQDQPYFFQD